MIECSALSCRSAISARKAGTSDNVPNTSSQVANLPPQMVAHTLSPTYNNKRLTHHPRLELAKPCGEGRNLRDCPQFKCKLAGPADWPMSSTRRAFRECPICDDKSYDTRTIRVIAKERVGVKIGAGPCRKDPGLEMSCGCAVM